ncbi:MAG: 3-oxoacyl-ACP reductase family protein [Dehalococcoidia bacterium]|jgi:NAD(P)-dependent dehydrogenase (short-subunit alcohol dehydrogenase family)|nr:3-oxoacyl-ACP reductase family protein [Dehalococcoidia bacterium]
MISPAPNLPDAIPDELSGRVVIVTGAGRGMGRAVAVRLAKAGASVAVNDLEPAAADETAELVISQGGTAIAVAGDISDSSFVESLVGDAVEEYGDVNILVNAAGILRRTAVFDMPETEWDFVMNVNLKGTFLCSKTVLISMRRSGWGRIVNFSSTAGKTTSTLGGAHYTASKHAVLGLTRHMAMEEAAHGITVNAVCPGLINTEMVQHEVDDERLKRYTDGFPIHRLGEPFEAAELVAFLASDRAAYITGQGFDISGGDLMV